jgi:hypothetical protein
VIALGEVGVTYDSFGMLFVVTSFKKGVWDEDVAVCLMLDDQEEYTKRIPGGTVMDVSSYTTMWNKAERLASTQGSGRVDP